MMIREIPVLDDSRCNGCGDCVHVCPVDCLAIAAELPWLIRPAICISCAACVAICPVDAISLQRPVPA